VLVLYASFLTRSGVLADFSVHSFAANDQWHLPGGLGGFLISFIVLAGLAGYGLLIWRLRDIPKATEALGSFSRESFMWLGQLVFMLMCALVAVGMSAPLITRLFGQPSNVQTSYYNLVNAPLAIAMGLLLGIAPLLRWRQHDPGTFLKAAMPAAGFGVVGGALAFWAGIRDPMPAGIVFAMCFALASNFIVTLRGFRASWKHGAAYLGHMGASIMLIGVIASSGYGLDAQIQLPRGEARKALGYDLVFQGMTIDKKDGKDHAIIAVNAPERKFTANAKFYWSEYNQGYMKKPHIERFWTHDIYISPLEMVGGRDEGGVWFEPGETKEAGNIKFTFQGFMPEPGEGRMKLTALLVADMGGRTVPLKPTFEMNMADGKRTATPAYLPSGGTVSIISGDPQTGRALLALPGMERTKDSETLAVEVSTKPFINLVWLGAVIMLGSAFLSMWRRTLDVKREPVKTA
jgi:cytochrome c-type biogenesis protein CcmF